jgi:hypothetical protein
MKYFYLILQGNNTIKQIKTKVVQPNSFEFFPIYKLKYYEVFRSLFGCQFVMKNVDAVLRV